MSVYSESEYGGADLYGAGLVQQKPQEPAKSPDPAIDPTEAASQALQVIANPLRLAGGVLTQDPAESKLPLGLAIIGACVAAIVLAAHFDGGSER